MNIIDRKQVQTLITKRPSHSHKGDYGRICLIGGNEQYGGAIILASEAAVHSGAGLTTTITSKKNHSSLHARIPESMIVDWTDIATIDKLVPIMDVVVIGPGLGLEPKSLELFLHILSLLKEKQTCVIDGSALTILASNSIQLPKTDSITYILTPHEKEWERLSGLTPDKQTTENNQREAKKLNSILILKKHRTEVYFIDKIWQNPVGTPAMATGGMGDTLAGMIGGFCAQFSDKEQAILSAVYLHSYIGEEIGSEQYVVLPSQIIQNISKTMKKFEEAQ